LRKALLAVEKGAYVLKAVEKRPPAYTERLKAGKKASCSHGKAKSWLTCW